MTRLNRLKGVTFTQPNLPAVNAFSDVVRNLPSLEAWFNGNSQAALRDGDGRITKWMERTDKGLYFSREGMNAAYTSPLYVASAHRGRPCIRFAKSATNPNALRCSGRLGPTVSGGSGTAPGTRKQTKIVVASFTYVNDGVGGNDQIASDTNPSAGWNALYVGGGYGQIQQTCGQSGQSSRQLAGMGGLINSPVPIVIVASLDDVNNFNRLRVNGTTHANNNVVDANVNVEANDLFIGTTITGAPGSSSDSGINMDLYEMIILGDDLLAPDKSTQLDALLDVIYASYGVRG